MKLNSLPYSRYLLPISLIVMLLVSAFVISSLVNFTAAEVNTTGTYFEVVPATSIADNETAFTIDINVTGAPPETHSWEVSLWFNNSILTALSVTKGDFFLAANATEVFYNALTMNAFGVITAGQSLHGTNSTSGSGKLCTVQFNVTKVDSSVLNLFDTRLGDIDGVYTHYPNNDGFFRETNAPVEDVAVTKVSTDVSSVGPAGTVNINVTVENEGDSTQSFDVIIYADAETHNALDPDQVMVGDEVTIGTWSVTNLASGTDTYNDTITWTPGNAPAETYHISAKAVLGVDDDQHDNILIGDTVKILVDPDLDISGVTVPSSVYAGESADIEFTVTNEGTGTATDFDVTIEANGMFVGNVTIASLGSGVSTTETFVWDTTGWGTDVTYTMNVTAEDKGERTVDLADNFVDTETILVKAVHDIGIYGLGVPVISVWVSESVTIKVRLINQGTESESFNLSVYADAREFDYVTNITVAAGATWDEVVTWDTTGSPGGAYVISAYVHVLPGELDTADNWFMGIPGSSIYVKVIPGDVNYDGKVTGLDQIIVGIHLFEIQPPP